MPTVPTYDGPRVQTAPLNAGYMRPVDVSSDLNRAAGALNTASDVLDRKLERDDQTAAFEAQGKITSAWLQWNVKAQQEHRGENVGGYTTAAQEWWKKAADEFGQELSPRAKQLASRGLMDRQFKALDSVGVFVANEKERHFDEVAAASITSSAQFGLTTGDVAGAAQQIREQVAGIGARKGWKTEQVAAEQLRQLSPMHLAYIAKLAEKDAAGAETYYQANKTEVAGQHQAKVEEILKGEADNQFAAKFAAENANKPLGEQLKAAGDITDPQRREKALTQIKSNHALVKQVEAEREAAASDQAWQLFAQGKRVPEAVLAQMDGKERAQLADAGRIRADRLAGGAKTVKTNPEALAKVYDLMRDDPEAFKKLRMGSLVEHLSGSDIEQVSRIQRDMLKPDKETGAITAVQAIEAYAEGLDKKDKTQFKQRAYDALDRFQMENKRAPSTAERRTMLDELTKEVVLHDGILWDTRGPAFKLDKQPAAAPAVRVKTVDEAKALPKGTKFIDPNGVERIR